MVGTAKAYTGLDFGPVEVCTVQNMEGGGSGTSMGNAGSGLGKVVGSERHWGWGRDGRVGGVERRSAAKGPRPPR
jgi:hypothetical protein